MWLQSRSLRLSSDQPRTNINWTCYFFHSQVVKVRDVHKQPKITSTSRVGLDIVANRTTTNINYCLARTPGDCRAPGSACCDIVCGVHWQQWNNHLCQQVRALLTRLWAFHVLWVVSDVEKWTELGCCRNELRQVRALWQITFQWRQLMSVCNLVAYQRPLATKHSTTLHYN